MPPPQRDKTYDIQGGSDRNMSRTQSNFSETRGVYEVKISDFVGRGLLKILQNFYEKASLLQELQLVNYYIPYFEF